jgi:hypothetical protein
MWSRSLAPAGAVCFPLWTLQSLPVPLPKRLQNLAFRRAAGSRRTRHNPAAHFGRFHPKSGLVMLALSLVEFDSKRTWAPNDEVRISSGMP